MKITLKNTRALLYLSIVNILICGLAFHSLYISDTCLFFRALVFLLCISAVFILIYFVRVLMFFSESTAVTAAYNMFTGIMVINIVTIIFPHLLKEDYVTWLSTLTLVISLLVAFRSFFVKAAPVKYSFMMLGGGIALLTLPRLLVLLVATSISGEVVIITGDSGLVIVLFASCLILKKLLNFLKAGEEVLAEAQVEPDNE